MRRPRSDGAADNRPVSKQMQIRTTNVTPWNIKISHFQAGKNHARLLHCEFFLQITKANSYLPILSKLTAALLVYKLCRAFLDSALISCSFQFCYFNTSILSAAFRYISGFIFYLHTSSRLWRVFIPTMFA